MPCGFNIRDLVRHAISILRRDTQSYSATQEHSQPNPKDEVPRGPKPEPGDCSMPESNDNFKTRLTISPRQQWDNADGTIVTVYREKGWPPTPQPTHIHA
ncbi:hypothetical protein P167DRAFT_73203 [Morchella conica CCBAS932]|uniref:Uncharacterized protein n=1 Tax=Morchella conica CCBAS932 TaxID=1392247 RepID=A0A3N4KU60_9PEZI|nr:hypothetical protein P167DRAFT_73203 [Morchella conica CCBAS932]